MATDVGPGDDDVLTPETVLDWGNDPADQDIAQSSESTRTRPRQTRQPRPLPPVFPTHVVFPAGAGPPPAPDSTAWLYNAPAFAATFPHVSVLHLRILPGPPPHYHPTNLVPLPTHTITAIVNTNQYTDADAQTLFDHTQQGSRVRVRHLPPSVPPAPEIRAMYFSREILSPLLTPHIVREFVCYLPTLYRVPHGVQNNENVFEALLGWRWPQNYQYFDREYVGRYILRKSFFNHPNLPLLRTMHSAYLDNVTAFAATYHPAWGTYLSHRYRLAQINNHLSFFSSHSITRDIGFGHVLHQHDDVGPTSSVVPPYKPHICRSHY